MWGICSCVFGHAETLDEALRPHHISANHLAGIDLNQKITGWAASAGEDPFLIAYYTDDGSGMLREPLHVMRYDRTARDLRRAGLRIGALSHKGAPMDCRGSTVAIDEVHGHVYVDTQLTPSAGCVLVLSPQLSLKTALYGWLLGVMGPDYAILHENEVHFAAVHPMRITIYDLKRNRQTEVYPPANDRLRQQFSAALKQHLADKNWCQEHNTPCDPGDFDNELTGNLTVNEPSRVFGFEATLDAAGFGDEAEEEVQPRVVVYVFRLKDGKWDYRQFMPEQLKQVFAVETVEELVSRKPDAAFDVAVGP